MYFAHPQVLNKNRGRQVGSKGKVSESIRWGFVEAYRQLGGVDGLVKWGREKPDLFYPLLKALLPHELAESGLAGNITVLVQRSPTEVVMVQRSPTEVKSSKSIPLEINSFSLPQADEAGGLSAGPGVPKGNPSGTASPALDGSEASPVQHDTASAADETGG